MTNPIAASSKNGDADSSFPSYSCNNTMWEQRRRRGGSLFSGHNDTTIQRMLVLVFLITLSLGTVSGTFNVTTNTTNQRLNQTSLPSPLFVKNATRKSSFLLHHVWEAYQKHARSISEPTATTRHVLDQALSGLHWVTQQQARTFQNNNKEGRHQKERRQEQEPTTTKDDHGILVLVEIAGLTNDKAGGNPFSVSLLQQLNSMGFILTGQTLFQCTGWLPVDQLDAIQALPQVKAIRPSLFETATSTRRKVTRAGGASSGTLLDDNMASRSLSSGTTDNSHGNSSYSRSGIMATTTKSTGRSLAAGGSVISEAVQALRVDEVRQTILEQGSNPSLTTLSAEEEENSKSLKIGILSDAFDTLGGYAADYASGDLPSMERIHILAERQVEGVDEGRAMMQLVHDLVPAAELVFWSAAHGNVNFAEGIEALANTGCQVIVDDIVYFAEPFFQDGIIAQAASGVVEQYDVPYFSSAGNGGHQSWEGNFVGSGQYDWNGCQFHNFAAPTPMMDIYQRITFEVDEETTKPAVLVLQWDDPFYSISGEPGATTDIDIWIFNNDADRTIQRAEIGVDIGADPVLLVAIPADVLRKDRTIHLAISHCTGPPPSKLKWVAFGSTESVEYDTKSSTTYGQANGQYTAGVGAVFFQDTPRFGTNPPKLQEYSGLGGTPILFDRNGQRYSQPQKRQQPRFTATDGCINTFFGEKTNLQPNGQGYYFFGTSAAAPNAAAVALLMLNRDPTLSANQIYTILESTAIDMTDTPGYDHASGFGLLNAFDAMALVTVPSTVPTPSPTRHPTPLPTRNPASDSVDENDLTCSWNAPACGNDNSCGDCKTTHPNAKGCNCPGCECTICKMFPPCCSAGWKSICAHLARKHCTCEAPPPTPSPTALPTPVPTEKPVEEEEEEEDALEENSQCNVGQPFTCPGGKCGNCHQTRGRGQTGCSCRGCECAVCNFIPDCCNKEWSLFCVAAAGYVCDC